MASFEWERGVGSGEQGAENGDRCSTGKVEAPGLCPQLALAGARPREAGASSLSRSVQRESTLAGLWDLRTAAVEQIHSVSPGISHVTCGVFWAGLLEQLCSCMGTSSTRLGKRLGQLWKRSWSLLPASSLSSSFLVLQSKEPSALHSESLGRHHVDTQ